MASLTRRFWRLGNSVMVRLYRSTGGKIGGKAPGGSTVLLLTVPGRKTGMPHTVPVSYVDHEGGYVVVGSNNGKPDDPQWFQNLRATERATVEIGESKGTVRVEVLEGAARNAAWDAMVAAGPRFADYQAKTERTIPVALLQREK